MSINDLYPKLVHKSSTTGTYKQKILELKDSFLALDTAKRYHAFVYCNNKIYPCENITGSSFTNAETYVPGNMATINKIDILAGVIETVRFTNNNITYTDLSNTSDAFEFYLYA